MRAIVTGSSGFIGHHLVKFLKMKGYEVTGIDNRSENHQYCDRFFQFDLRDSSKLDSAFFEIDEVYALAAQNGSIEYTSKVKADLVYDNALINLNTAQACIRNGVGKLFFASSACVYPENLQGDNPTYLTEEDAYPAKPDSEYGWEKLFSERMYQSFEEDYGLQVRIARFFNIYGEEGHYDPLRSKAPTALARKVAKSSNGEVEVWGRDGGVIRSFCYIDDCCEAIYRIMKYTSSIPFNVGTDEHMSVDQLIDTIIKVSGKDLKKKYNPLKTEGVRNRLCDYSRIRSVLKWEPKVSFEEGIRRTYEWVKSQY